MINIDGIVRPVDEIIELLNEAFDDHIQVFDCEGMDDGKIVLYELGDTCVLYQGYYGYIDVLGLSNEDYEKLRLGLNDNFKIEY